MEYASLAHLIENLRSAWAEVVSLECLDDASWFIELDDDIGIMAEWIDSPPRLVLASAVGQPPTDRLFVVYEYMLRFNALWHKSGGMHAGLMERDGDIMLFFEVTQVELTVAAVQTLLSQWSATARSWRAYVSAPQAGQVLPHFPFFELGLKA